MRETGRSPGHDGPQHSKKYDPGSVKDRLKGMRQSARRKPDAPPLDSTYAHIYKHTQHQKTRRVHNPEEDTQCEVPASTCMHPHIYITPTKLNLQEDTRPTEAMKWFINADTKKTDAKAVKQWLCLYSCLCVLRIRYFEIAQFKPRLEHCYFF